MPISPTILKQLRDDGTILQRLFNSDARLESLNLASEHLVDADIIQLCLALKNNTTLRKLVLSNNQIGDAGAQALAQNQTLLTLDLSLNKIAGTGAKALAQNKTLSTLNLQSNQIDAAGTQALAENKTLSTLSLRDNQIDAAGAEALAQNQTLHTLDLSSNQIGDAGAKALAQNQTLRTLNLSCNKICGAGVQALAQSQTLCALELGLNDIGDVGAKALAQNKILRTLGLSCSNIGVAGAQALAQNQTLHTLDLTFNLIGKVGAQVLAKNKTLRTCKVDSDLVVDIGDAAIDAKVLQRLRNNDASLKELSLRSKHLSDVDIIQLCKALKTNTSLSTLDLSSNTICDTGAQALAESKTLSTLNLSGNQICDAGAKALAQNKTLTTLNLYGNRIGAEGAQALAQNKTLSTLDLSGLHNSLNFNTYGQAIVASSSHYGDCNQIGDAGAKALAQNQTLSTLFLGCNQIGDAGAQALAENKTLSMLHLGGNQICDAGAQALAQNNTLSTLGLNYNQIGAVGAQALAQNKTLSTLFLQYSQIGDAGAQALAQNKTLSTLNLEYSQIGDVPKTQVKKSLEENVQKSKALVIACQSQNLTEVQRLLQSGILAYGEYIQALAPNKDTLLHLAVRQRNLPLLSCLLSKNLDKYTKNKDDLTYQQLAEQLGFSLFQEQTEHTFPPPLSAPFATTAFPFALPVATPLPISQFQLSDGSDWEDEETPQPTAKNAVGRNKLFHHQPQVIKKQTPPAKQELPQSIFDQSSLVRAQILYDHTASSTDELTVKAVDIKEISIPVTSSNATAEPPATESPPTVKTISNPLAISNTQAIPANPLLINPALQQYLTFLSGLSQDNLISLEALHKHGANLNRILPALTALQTNQETLTARLLTVETQAGLDAQTLAEIAYIQKNENLYRYYTAFKKTIGPTILAAQTIISTEVDGASARSTKLVNGVSKVVGTICPPAAPFLSFAAMIVGTVNERNNLIAMETLSGWAEIEEMALLSSMLARYFTFALEKQLAHGLSSAAKTTLQQLQEKCSALLESIQSGTILTSEAKRAIVDAKEILTHMKGNARRPASSVSDCAILLLRVMMGDDYNHDTKHIVSVVQQMPVETIASSASETFNATTQSHTITRKEWEALQKDKKEMQQQLEKLSRAISNVPSATNFGVNGQLLLTLEAQTNNSTGTGSTTERVNWIYETITGLASSIADLGVSLVQTQEQVDALEKNGQGSRASSLQQKKVSNN